MIDDWFVSLDGKRCYIRTGDKLDVVRMDALDDLLLYRSVDGRPTLWNDVFFTDPSPWPRFVLFPRLERARIAAQDAVSRVREAWRVLRGRDGAQSEWEDA